LPEEIIGGPSPLVLKHQSLQIIPDSPTFVGPAPSKGRLDHDDFGLNQSKIINVIEINNLEHDVIAKVSQLWRIML
jgi:hypothetical protein